MSKSRDHAGVVVPPPLFYLVPFLIGVLLHRIAPSDRIPDAIAPPARVLGAALVLSGVSLGAGAILTFRRHRTTILPAHRPTTIIVSGGPYRFTRNPMYIGLALLYLGIPLFAGITWPYALLPLAILAIDRLVIPREERYLEGKFGEEYRRYKTLVRRWL